MNLTLSPFLLIGIIAIALAIGLGIVAIRMLTGRNKGATPVPTGATPVTPSPSPAGPLPASPMGTNIAPVVLPAAAQAGFNLGSNLSSVLFLLGAVVVLGGGLVAGVVLIQRQQSQDIRSKATGGGDLNCYVKWASNCDGSLSPANGSTTSNLHPHFHWVYGGEDGSACSPTLDSKWDCAGYGARVVLYEGSNQIGASPADIVGPANYGTLFNLETGNLQMSAWARANGYTGTTNEPNYLSDLKPATTYTWHVDVRYRPKTGCTNCGDDVHPGGPTWTFTTPPAASVASCQNVTADKNLSAIAIGDTVTFTGKGTVSSSSDQIDLINFIILNGTTTVFNDNVPAVLDSGNAYKATKSIAITDPGTYTVRIRVHQKGSNQWFE